jgi:hypothetical protein
MFTFENRDPHERDQLTFTQALVLFRAATDPGMSLGHVNRIFKQNVACYLQDTRISSKLVGAMIREWHQKRYSDEKDPTITVYDGETKSSIHEEVSIYDNCIWDSAR